MNKSASVSVIGPGALGSALVDLLLSKSSRYTLYSVWGRNPQDGGFKQGEEWISADKSYPETTQDPGRVIFITTPDDQIRPVAEQLTRLDLDWNLYRVAHFSGSYDSSILDSLAGKGAKTASVHPLQTFTKGDQADRFDGIWFTLEGDPVFVDEMSEFVQTAGAKSVRLDASQKKSMHLAAVFASNYLVSLMSVVEQITSSNNIDHGLELLEPIIHQTVRNILDKGPEQSLSGPISRGDSATVERHLNELKHHPDISELYSRLGNEALQIAKRSGRLNDEQYNLLKRILSGQNEQEK